MSILDYDTVTINENTPFERVAVVTPIKKEVKRKDKHMKVLIPVKGNYTRKMYRKIGYYVANNGDDYILPIYESGNIREVMYYTLQAIKHRIDTELL